MDSGIDSTKVEQIETNKNNILSLYNNNGKTVNMFNITELQTVTVVHGTKTMNNNILTLTATGNDCYTAFQEQLYPISARVPVVAGEKYIITWDYTANNQQTNDKVLISTNGQATSGAFVVVDATSEICEYTAPTGATYITLRFGVTTAGNSADYSKIQVQTKALYDAGFTEYQDYSLSNAALTNNYLPYNSNYIYKTFTIPKQKFLSGNATANNTTYIRLPETYKPYGTPTKLCIICHGSTKGIKASGTSTWTTDILYNNIVNKLLINGYAVMDSNGYDDSIDDGFNHWGCLQALNGYVKAYDYFTNNYNLDKNVYIYGFSMGGLTALSLALYATIKCRCCMVASPVISLYNQCVEGRETPLSSFLTAYDMTTYDANKCLGYDRYFDIITLDNSNYIKHNYPPLFFAIGSTDTNISNAIVSEFCAALKNSNYNAELKEYVGGHEISYGGNADVRNDMISFFNYY